MTAFLHLPSSRGMQLGRRVDLANIGGLFGHVEDPAPIARSGALQRIAAASLVLLFALGDTMLIAWPGALTACLHRCETTISATAL